jgi:hypothetical protein
MKPSLILDTKIRSPFGWRTDQSWVERLEMAIEYGDIIAVQTMGGWAGSLNLIKEARQATSKPILAKGIHRTDKEIDELLNLGVTYVLVVGRVPSEKYIDKCMLEPSCLREIEDYPKNAKVVWNTRNLLNGLPKKETLEEAREKWDGWLCQASMIECVKDINPNVEAVMVGTHMEWVIEGLGVYNE